MRDRRPGIARAGNADELRGGWTRRGRNAGELAVRRGDRRRGGGATSSTGEATFANEWELHDAGIVTKVTALKSQPRSSMLAGSSGPTRRRPVELSRERARSLGLRCRSTSRPRGISVTSAVTATRSGRGRARVRSACNPTSTFLRSGGSGWPRGLWRIESRRPPSSQMGPSERVRDRARPKARARDAGCSAARFVGARRRSAHPPGIQGGMLALGYQGLATNESSIVLPGFVAVAEDDPRCPQRRGPVGRRR